MPGQRDLTEKFECFLRAGLFPSGETACSVKIDPCCRVKVVTFRNRYEKYTSPHAANFLGRVRDHITHIGRRLPQQPHYVRRS